MSKKSKKCSKRVLSVENVSGGKTEISVKPIKTKEHCFLNIVISPIVLKRWAALRTAFCCETNEDFVTKLLELAQNSINSENKSTNVNHLQKENKTQNVHLEKNNKQKKAPQIKKEKKERKLIKFPLNEDIENRASCAISVNISEDYNRGVIITEQALNDTSEPNIKTLENSSNNYSIVEENKNFEVTATSLPIVPEKSDKTNKKKKSTPDISDKGFLKDKIVVKKDNYENDIRKAPKLECQIENFENKVERNDSLKNVTNVKVCNACNTQHFQDKCPVYSPHYIVNDSINLSDWEEKFKSISDKIKSESIKVEKDHEVAAVDDDKDRYTFCKLSLPGILYLSPTDSSHGVGIFAKGDLGEFTKFGPLLGKTIKEVDIPEDSNLRDIWEIYSESVNTYLNTEDLDVSNWLRFIRPAPSREERNITVINKDNSLYFVTIKHIKSEEELLFWQDTPLNTGKKRLEKTSCGGCNMTFTHPLYYRTHCSVFHDLRYSLTIRKYHCKICGAAVLGKENIMKHAAELHNGQGAYQCQFCKKFFLRLNYLEMHRTYGCSANPHRSRPLCDFCGRKFCQPQKLKVHIKRMHSDFSEVLKEFQCKSCLKILGSRAALQRHAKEVHQKQVDSTCSCIKCGKHFQNKSNLKIHMLTHSGIKPFKCAMGNCNAAFTTKQCLQFHYKKVHNLTEDAMPKIERSVDYTFEAYSGLEDGEPSKEDKGNIQTDSTAATLDETSDFDDNSVDSKTLDDPPAIQSPLQLSNQNSPESVHTTNDNYTLNSLGNGMKILTKGSKKWIADEPLQNQTLRTDMYQLDQNLRSKDDLPNITLQVQESHLYDRTKLNTNLNTFSRHETSNASLLVEAALDSVCSEPNIDIDVSTTPNCTDSLVNNLYTLAPNDGLGDVSYSESVCMNEPRDINLISPSVNDHISVTDELNDELHQNQTMGMDYSTFHHEEFSPANSPGIPQRNNFVRNYINSLSPSNQNYNNQSKTISPVPSPPRYDFGHAVNPDHLSSDDSNGIGAQNLSLHGTKHDLQLDLSIYKSYKLDQPTFQTRKDFRIRFDNDNDRKQVYILDTDNVKNYQDAQTDQNQVDTINQNDLAANIQDDVMCRTKETEDAERSKYPDDLANDLRHKFDLDLDLRIKNYDVDVDVTRNKNSYETQSDLDFRAKNYDLIDSMENRTKVYESTLETDFRSDRSFEPLMLNSSELQGLDMSARSFHNYPNINRYHHLYPDVDRVDLRLNYSPPPPSYTHADILRVVSLDLTPPGRHSVDLSLRTHPLHQIANSRLLTDHRLLSSDLTAARHLSSESRLLSETTGRILSDHTTNRILSNSDQLTTNHLLTSEQTRLLSEDSRLISDQTRLLDQTRLIGDGRMLPPTTPNGSVSPVPTFTGYSVSQSPYHPTPLAPRPHVTSPTPTPYHHYTPYY